MLEQIYACLQKCPFLHQLNNEKKQMYIYICFCGWDDTGKAFNI